jgi:hypothetical protein
VPDSNPETWESDFAKLAAIALQQRVPILAERIYSITFVHEGEEWIATVGETLHGFRLGWTDRKRTQTKRLNPVSDPAKVLAIFAGRPYAVVIKYPQTGYARSAWENPFYVSEHSLKDEVRFATP